MQWKNKKFAHHLLMLTIASVSLQAQPWSFGVMGDTQWRQNLDGENPGTVAAGIIRQINNEFIQHRVRFVAQVGDLVDTYSDANGRFNVRAAACADLYAAGIGFFPVRGNHESCLAAANELPMQFPQTTGSGSYVFGATDFSSPMTSLSGLSYSFRYQNATFIFIDQFSRKSGSATGIADQITWMNSVLSTRPANTHAFVLAHKNLCGGNHADGLFGATPATTPADQNNFYRACASNGVRYFMSGHDHMHLRSVMTSPDRLWNIEQLIASSNSYKFYIPLTGTTINDIRYNIPPRETPVAQELFTIGYYIFTVNGPMVTVDYYASPNGCNGDCDLSVTPRLTFSKRETWGYGLNGKQFVIPPGGSLQVIRDTVDATDNCFGTRMAVLDGVNTVTATWYDGRAAASAVATGWVSRSTLGASYKSDAVTLLGMSDSIGVNTGDPFALSLSYDAAARGPIKLMSGNDDGSWSPAATAAFIIGPFKSSYGPGTYGIDPSTKSVWAIVNHGGRFAAASSSDGDQNGDGIIDNTDISLVMALRGEPADIAPEADLDGDGTITILDARKLALLKN